MNSQFLLSSTGSVSGGSAGCGSRVATSSAPMAISSHTNATGKNFGSSPYSLDELICAGTMTKIISRPKTTTKAPEMISERRNRYLLRRRRERQPDAPRGRARRS